MSDAAVQKERVSAEQIGVMRGVTISEVLGTDMKKHFDITSRFQVSPPKALQQQDSLSLIVCFVNRSDSRAAASSTQNLDVSASCVEK